MKIGPEGSVDFAVRAAALQPSPLQQFFLKVKAAEAAGRNIISLGVGEPHYDVHPSVKEAAIEAIKKGVGYSPAIGSLALRQAIADSYGISSDRVAVGTGAKALLAAVFGCLIEDWGRTSLLLPMPYYPPFLEVACHYYRAEPVLIDTEPEDFKLTLRAVQAAAKQAIGRKILIINSPNNPTGMVYDRDELEWIVAWCAEEDITVISDECYRAFSPDPGFSLRFVSPDVIVVDSFSKSYAMMGYRLGYVIAPQEVISRLQLYAGNLLGCPSAIAEAAALAALDQMPVPDYKRQRQIIQQWLDERNAPYGKSKGGIYAFADFSEQAKRLGLAGSVGLADYLLDQAGVAVTPGSAFGSYRQDFLRLSYSLDKKRLLEGLIRLDRALF